MSSKKQSRRGAAAAACEGHTATELRGAGTKVKLEVMVRLMQSCHLEQSNALKKDKWYGFCAAVRRRNHPTGLSWFKIKETNLRNKYFFLFHHQNKSHKTIHTSHDANLTQFWQIFEFSGSTRLPRRRPLAFKRPVGSAVGFSLWTQHIILEWISRFVSAETLTFLCPMSPVYPFHTTTLTLWRWKPYFWAKLDRDWGSVQVWRWSLVRE